MSIMDTPPPEGPMGEPSSLGTTVRFALFFVAFFILLLLVAAFGLVAEF